VKSVSDKSKAFIELTIRAKIIGGGDLKSKILGQSDRVGAT